MKTLHDNKASRTKKGAKMTGSTPMKTKATKYHGSIAMSHNPGTHSRPRATRGY